MKAYDSYKDSGIQWLPKIPSHWNSSKIKSHFRLRSTKVSDQDFPALSVSKNGVTPQLETAVKTDNGDNRKLVKAGDFVVNSRSDRKGSCGVSSLDGSVSLINIVLEPIDGYAQYYHHLFRSNNYIEEFYRNGRGIVSDLWTTRWNEMSSIMIPFPPTEEQEKIVAFLDKQITLIESCKCQRERELQALNELKQAEIASVVTRGLNPNVPMKDSGIPWIGQIPAHWNTKRLASHFHNRIENNSDFEFKRAFKFNYGTIVPKEETSTPEEYHDVYVKYSKVKKNDIMINGLNLNYDFVSQRVAIVPEDGIITSAYVVLRPFETTYAPYYCYLFKAMDSMKLFHAMGTGIRLTLSFDELKKQIIPIPPIDEQKAIVDYIENRCNRIDSLINNLKKEIESLQEYKQRLISDVVTGQIDVRREEIA